MTPEVEAFAESFAELLSTTAHFCYMTTAGELQEAMCHSLSQARETALALKAVAIAAEDEDSSNALLAYESMAEALIHELNLWLALKDARADDAWFHLVKARLRGISAARAHEVGHGMQAYVDRLVGLEHVLFPPQKFFSRDAVVRAAKCSICGEDYSSCDHVVRRPYMGQLCTRILTKVDIVGFSVVDEPADKMSRVTRVRSGGPWYDTLTGRVVVQVDQTNEPPLGEQEDP